MRRAFREALPIVAQALGDKYGVQVVIKGDDAYTDGETIVLPELPVSGERAETLMRGFLDHEAAHIRWTRGKPEGTPLEKSLQNILEDVRIEKMMGDRFPGSRANLNRLARLLAEDGSLRPPGEGDHPAAVLGLFLLLKLRADLLGQEALKPLAAQAAAVFRQVYSDSLMIRTLALGKQVLKCRSTDEVKALVRRILEAIREEAGQECKSQSGPQGSGGHGGQGQGQETQPGGQSGQSGQSGQDGGSQSGSDGSQDGGSRAGDGDGSDGGASGAGGAGGGGDGAAAGAAGAEDQTPGEQSSSDGLTGAGGAGAGPGRAAKAAQEALEAREGDLRHADVGRLAAEALRGAVRKTKSPRTPVAETVDKEEVIIRDGLKWPSPKEVRRATNALRVRLEGLLQARKLARVRLSRTGRRIDTARIHRVRVGDTRIFRSMQERKGVNTAVLVLMDRSGSMHSQIRTACEAVYAAALAMESLPGVAVETAVFPVGYANVAVLTRFGERVRPCDYKVYASGGTPMAEALWWAAAEILKRPEPRKIVLVATDGVPNSPVLAQDAVRAMTEQGIEVISLGIGKMAVVDLFPVHRRIRSIEEMPAALIGMLQERLLEAA